MKGKLLETISVESQSEFEFREICGFTFVFLRNILIFEDKITSGEIRPVAIIYEENGEFYLAPLDEVNDIDAIVEKYVEDCIKKN
jgi:hypothetical protein